MYIFFITKSRKRLNCLLCWQSFIFEQLNPAVRLDFKKWVQTEIEFVESFQGLECAPEQWSDCQQDVSHVRGRACEPLFCFYAREWASVSSISLFFGTLSWWLSVFHFSTVDHHLSLHEALKSTDVYFCPAWMKALQQHCKCFSWVNKNSTDKKTPKQFNVIQ